MRSASEGVTKRSLLRRDPHVGCWGKPIYLNKLTGRSNAHNDSKQSL
jgi:hypothetical protein